MVECLMCVYQVAFDRNSHDIYLVECVSNILPSLVVTHKVPTFVFHVLHLHSRIDIVIAGSSLSLSRIAICCIN